MRRDRNGFCCEDLHVAVGDRRVVMDGLTARGNRNTFVAVDLGMEADPGTFTPELIESEKAGMPGWRFKKEYLRDWDAQTGQPVFEEEWIDRQRQNARDPIERLDIHRVTRDGIVQRDRLGHVKYILVPKAKGRLKIFTRPDSQPAGWTEGSPRVIRAAGMGMDVGEGVEKSDSTLAVMFADTRELAATLACNRIRPGQLGRFAAAVGRHYNNALICCVRKMHGLTALRAIADSGYPMIWHNRDPKKTAQLQSKDLGWPRGEATSDLLFGKWIAAMETEGLATLRCLETIEQHRAYIYDDLGRPTHQRLKSQPVAVREKHGDLVIAAALAYRACIDIPKFRKAAKDAAPAESPAGRRRARKQAASTRRGGDEW